MKHILFIIDGAADVPEDAKTPLECAKADNPLHVYAQKSICGVADTTYPSAAPGTDVAICRLFGASEGMTWGRGALEAADYGITGDFCYLRCNISSLSEDGKLLAHDGGAAGEEGAALMRAVCEDAQVQSLLKDAGRLYPGTSFRHLMETKLDWAGFTPPHDCLGAPYPEAPEPWDAVFARAKAVLEAQPFNARKREKSERMANVLWPWGGGRAPKLRPFEASFGMKGASVSAVAVVRGIARLCGLRNIDVPGATGYLDTNWRGKVDAALGCEEPFVLLHIEAPDECSHGGTRPGKEQAVAMAGDMLERMVSTLDFQGESYRILFLSDHVTSLKTRSHDRQPVPFALFDSRAEKSGVPFTEPACAGTGLRAGGEELLEILIKE